MSKHVIPHGAPTIHNAIRSEHSISRKITHAVGMTQPGELFSVRLPAGNQRDVRVGFTNMIPSEHAKSHTKFYCTAQTVAGDNVIITGFWIPA